MDMTHLTVSQQQALQQLPALLQREPIFLQDDNAMAALRTVAWRDFHIDVWTLQSAVNEYKASVATPAPAPAVVDLATRIACDRTGLLRSVLDASVDVQGNVQRALQGDFDGNIEAAVLAGMLDRSMVVRDALLRDQDGSFAAMLARDPLGRLAGSYQVLAAHGVQPVDMPSIGRLREVASSNSLPLHLPNTPEYA